MKRLTLPACTLALIAIMVSYTTAFAQSEPKRQISEISDGLYRFQNNFHFSVFLVTEEGILVTDPINADAARWLKSELASRFGKPIKYLVLSHDHADHSAGGEVFSDTATVVAHENARATIIGESRPTAVPQLTFSDRMTLHLGGQQVELIYPGRSHSDNLIVIHFPAQRAVFTVDFITVRRLPYRNLSDAYFPDWIDAIKAVEQIDFDILVPGHGETGTKADATNHRYYLQVLYDAVLDAARRGLTLEEMQQTITLEEFSHFGQFEAWRPLNIEGMYRQISLHRRGN